MPFPSFYFMNRILKSIVWVAFLLLLEATVRTSAQRRIATLDREYEPRAINGSVLEPLYGVPIDQIHMYAYRASSKTWEMIPFQIDERVWAPDPYEEGNFRYTYFEPDDGLLDEDDELVFMLRDLGDQAPEDSWIDNDEARHYPRLELEVYDKAEPSKRAWGYLFRSSTIMEGVPKPYKFSFDPVADVVETKYYSVGFGDTTGLVEDIIIKPPYGTGVDIFDTQKIRMVCLFTFFAWSIPFGRDYNPQAANERDNLFIYSDSTKWTPNPVVRLVRQVVQTVRFGGYILSDAAFPVQTKFYPFSGVLSGGADLGSLGENMDLELDLLRQSWDFSPQATGMRLYNKYNKGILIDGNLDQVNRTIDLPVKEWTMVTGTQGTLLTIVSFVDTIGAEQQLYYYDNSSGGQGDGTFIYGGDTGDGASYGDVGLLFTGQAFKANLKLDFTAYFLPHDLSKSEAERIVSWTDNPTKCKSRAQTYSTSVANRENTKIPNTFKLFQNYPNPFNSSTKMAFSLLKPQVIRLRIMDINGKTIATLAKGRFEAGLHEVSWNGLDDKNQQVPSGIYFYQLSSRDFSFAKKMILVR